MSGDTTKGGLNPAALRPKDAAKALGISEDMLRADIDAGAPTNTDGTISVIHYAAWLNKVAKEDADGN